MCIIITCNNNRYVLCIPWSSGLYALYKPGNKEVIEKNIARGRYLRYLFQYFRVYIYIYLYLYIYIYIIIYIIYIIYIREYGSTLYVEMARKKMAAMHFNCKW